MTESHRTFPAFAAFLLLALGASLAFLPGGQELGEDQELPEGVTRAMVNMGREIFVGKGACLTCHGEEAEGTPVGPALVQHEWVHIDGSYPAIVALIKEGVAEPQEFPMPMLPRAGTEITDEEVKAVAAYVWLISRPQ